MRMVDLLIDWYTYELITPQHSVWVENNLQLVTIYLRITEASLPP